MARWSEGGSQTEVKPKALTIVCYVTYIILSIPFNLAPIFLTVLEFQYAQPGQTRLTDEDLGRITAAPFLGVSVSTIGTALIAARFGAKPAGLFGNAVTCLGLVLSGLAPEYWTLCVALFVLGLGAGAIDMVIPPVVSALNPTARGAHMNYLNAIYWAGAVAANFLVISALWLGMTFNQCCFMLAPFPALALVGMLFYKFPPLTEGPAMSFCELVRRRFFHLLVLFSCFLAFFLFTLPPLSPLSLSSFFFSFFSPFLSLLSLVFFLRSTSLFFSSPSSLFFLLLISRGKVVPSCFDGDHSWRCHYHGVGQLDQLLCPIFGVFPTTRRLDVIVVWGVYVSGSDDRRKAELSCLSFHYLTHCLLSIVHLCRGCFVWTA